jgi:uncharacterized protein
MNISLDTHAGAYHIKSYQPGKLIINEQQHVSSVIISLTQLITNWRPQTLAELNLEDFAAILALEPEIVLLGTGEHLLFPDPALLIPCYEQKVGIEVMNTQAACRTFEVLAAENRRVVAALLV